MIIATLFIEVRRDERNISSAFIQRFIIRICEHTFPDSGF